MHISDLLDIGKWWLSLFGISLLFLPLTNWLFKRFFDQGYIFAKILGLGICAYLVFVAGILHLLAFSQTNILILLLCFFILDLYLFRKHKSGFVKILINNWQIFLFEELLFFITLLFWSVVRSYQPDIHGLEKFMDFGFVNSILRSTYFPPKDMWFTPFPINYYYFGHLITAMLTKITAIPSFITYNLMIATLFAFTFTGAFSLGANFLNALCKTGLKQSIGRFKLIIGGIVTAFLVALGGNLHTIYTFFTSYPNENPVPFWNLKLALNSFPNSYWYPNATRFIYHTIHEFPIYSFVVSDLHGHVIDILFVLLTIAILFSLLLDQKYLAAENIKDFSAEFFLVFKNYKWQYILLSLLLAIMYMTNAWDSLIYFLLIGFVTFYLYFTSLSKSKMSWQEKSKAAGINSLITLALVFAGYLLFSLPFAIYFKPFASGIGILCSPNFLTHIGRIGPFLFEPNHCQKSPLWQLLILYGFFYFWIFSFIIFILKQSTTKIFKSLNVADYFVLILILTSTILIIIPEFIYLKDIYPTYYRANTMFKLVYQAFIMLSLSSGYIMFRIISNLKLKSNPILKIGFLMFSAILLFFVSIYPYFAITSYYNFNNYVGLNGISYLQKLYPDDYQAILWLNHNIQGQPVILEAQGDSYTDYARISANTGLPTVLGWTVHEWLWRGSYDIPAPRITDVKNLYETKDLQVAKQLIKQYQIKLIVVGDLERQKYPQLDEAKFALLGKLIYVHNSIKIYQISNY